MKREGRAAVYRLVFLASSARILRYPEGGSRCSLVTVAVLVALGFLVRRTEQGWHGTSKQEADRGEASADYADCDFKVRPFHNVRLVPGRVDGVSNVDEELESDDGDYGGATRHVSML
jgi:hypothetical protein